MSLVYGFLKLLQCIMFFFCFIVSSALRCPLMTVLFMFGVKILVVAYFLLIRFHSFLHVQESTLF